MIFGKAKRKFPSVVIAREDGNHLPHSLHFTKAGSYRTPATLPYYLHHALQNSLLLEIQVDSLGHDVPLAVFHLYHRVILRLLVFSFSPDLVP